MKALNQIPVELIFWLGAMGLLATAEPHCLSEHSLFTLCPLANLGLEWCPGCGLGRSITQIFHGNIAESVKLHWFGIPALMLICCRIGTLIKLEYSKMFNYKNIEEDYV